MKLNIASYKLIHKQIFAPCLPSVYKLTFSGFKNGSDPRAPDRASHSKLIAASPSWVTAKLSRATKQIEVNQFIEIPMPQLPTGEGRFLVSLYTFNGLSLIQPP
jgi:hypothetical protein